MDDHVIYCNLTDIPMQITGVTWNPAATKIQGYTLEDGIFDPETKSQLSKLTISAVKLLELRNSAESHSFICEITVGSKNWTVADIQTITIFSPSKIAVLTYAH